MIKAAQYVQAYMQYYSFVPTRKYFIVFIFRELNYNGFSHFPVQNCIAVMDVRGIVGISCFGSFNSRL